MKLGVVRPFDVAHRDLRAAHPVDAPLQAGQVETVGQIETDHLAPAVHAGVGASRAHEVGRAADDPLDCSAQLAHDRPHADLLGKAGEVGAVVGHGESCSTHHGGQPTDAFGASRSAEGPAAAASNAAPSSSQALVYAVADGPLRISTNETSSTPVT